MGECVFKLIINGNSLTLKNRFGDIPHWVFVSHPYLKELPNMQDHMSMHNKPAPAPAVSSEESNENEKVVSQESEESNESTEDENEEYLKELEEKLAMKKLIQKYLHN